MSSTLLLTPPQLAVMVTDAGAATGLVRMTKAPFDPPAGTATVAATDATEGLELVRATLRAAVAGTVNVKCSVTEFPPVIVS